MCKYVCLCVFVFFSFVLLFFSLLWLIPRAEYVDAYVKYELLTSVKQQFDAFASGFGRLFSGPIVGIFRPEELEVLVVGKEELDFAALERVATVRDGRSSSLLNL